MILKEFIDLDLVFSRAGIAADNRCNQEGHIKVLHQRGADELTPMLGHAAGIVRFILFKVLRKFLHGEFRIQNYRNSVEQRQMHADHHAVDDERRQFVVPDVLAFNGESDISVAPSHVVGDLIGDHNALRQAGGTAGVDDDAAGIFLIIGLDIRSAFTGSNKIIIKHNAVAILDFRMILTGLEVISKTDCRGHGIADLYNHDFFNRGIHDGFLNQRVVQIQSDENLRIDLMDVVLERFHIRAGIDEVHGSTDLVGTIEGVYDFRHIHQAYHDIVIFLDAGSSQGTGGLIDVLEHLAEGSLLAEIVQCDLIRVVFVDIMDKLIHGKTLWRLRTDWGIIHKVFLPGHIVHRFLWKVFIKFFPWPIN